jgi:hypothetical protein
MPRDAVEEIEMSRGGARNRSGPPLDPTSGRSDRRGFRLDALPAEGYDGEVPRYPLPTVGEAAFREDELWAWAWRTPQAAAWAREPWRWHAVAMWVRTARICESEDATAADKNSLHRFADQIGFSPAGLKENGWKIATDEIAAKRATPAAAPDEDDPDDPRGRLTVVRDVAAG